MLLNTVINTCILIEYLDMMTQIYEPLSCMIPLFVHLYSEQPLASHQHAQSDPQSTLPDGGYIIGLLSGYKCNDISFFIHVV